MSGIYLCLVLVVFVAAGCGPREVMRVGSDRAVPASETTGGSSGPAPSGPVRTGGAGSSTRAADPTVDQVDANGNVVERADDEPVELDLDRGQDYDD